MDPTILFVGMIAGAFGTGYFVYGKKSGTVMPMISGLLLCFYPYFFENIFALIGIGIILIILPFILRF